MPRKLNDTNIPMNIKDDGKIIKKYSRKLKTIPTELQKYNEYLTKSQPILDEANYVASRRKDKRTKKKEEDFEFIEDLKDKRRAKLASAAEKRRDMTPLILTDFELTNPKTDLFSTLEGIFPTNSQDNMEAVKKIQGAVRAKLARDEVAKEKDEEAVKKIQAGIRGKIAREGKKRNEIDKAFEEARKEIEKDAEAAKKIQAGIRGKIAREGKRRNEIDKAFEEARKEIEEEKAASTIERAILGKVKRERAKKIQKGLEEQLEKNKINKYGDEFLPENRLMKALKKKGENKEFFEITRGEPELSRRGRPAGSKNKK